MQSRLSPQIVALIHQSELNRAGWIDAHKQHAISALFWLEDRPLSASDIAHHQEEVGLTGMQLPEIDHHLANLADDDVLIRLNNQTYRLSQSAYDQISVDVENAEGLEDAVVSHFCELVETRFRPHLTMDAPKLWQIFHQTFLTPLIESFGARTYEVLTGNIIEIDQTPFALNFLDGFSEEQRPYVRQLFEAFLEPSSRPFRSYTLRLLNSHLFSIANRYTRENLEALYSDRKRPIIRCLLDTNFLYSVLDLHENPSNEAAKALLETIGNAQKYIDVRLYVFPPTIDELRRSLINHEDMLSGIRVTGNISDAVTERTVGGVGLKYIKECRRSGYSLTARDYFEPYHSNLTQILREKGIHLFNEITEHYATDQRVIDDALDQQNFLNRRHKKNRIRGHPKHYDQIWHDMLLWYFILDKRPAHFESILDVDTIGITVDYSLIGFDLYKRRDGTPRIPVLIHPATLIQVFQFFVPFNERFESAIIDTLRMPFLLRDFDSNSEKITIRILNRLSRFENIEDLSPNTIRCILESDILQNKLQKMQNEEEEVNAIREALIEENARARDDLSDALEREGNLRQQIGNLQDHSTKDQHEIAGLKDKIAKETRDKEELTDQLQLLQSEITKSTEQAERDATRKAFLSKFVRWPSIVGLLVAAMCASIFEIDMQVESLLLFSVPTMTVLLIWLYVIWLFGRKNDHIRSWRWFERLNSVRYKLGSVALAVYVGLWVAAYLEILKAPPGID